MAGRRHTMGHAQQAGSWGTITRALGSSSLLAHTTQVVEGWHNRQPGKGKKVSQSNHNQIQITVKLEGEAEAW